MARIAENILLHDLRLECISFPQVLCVTMPTHLETEGELVGRAEHLLGVVGLVHVHVAQVSQEHQVPRVLVGEKQRGQLGKQAGQLGKQAGQLGKQGGQLGKQAGQLGKQAGQLGKQRGQLRKQGGQLGKQAGQLGKQAGQLGKQAGQLGKQAGQLGKQAGQLGKQAGHVFVTVFLIESVMFHNQIILLQHRKSIKFATNFYDLSSNWWPFLKRVRRGFIPC